MNRTRALTRIIFILFVAMVVFCLSCRERLSSEGLYFVGSSESGQKQSLQRGLVVVTHGWIKKGRGGWPENMAVEINKHVDSNLWVCGYFDWSKGARTFNATDAAKYARDIAGPKLAKDIVEAGNNWRHLHLIGHSGGCWAISEAAKLLAKKTKADIHLTFFDAYVPAFWDESSLGDVNAPADVKFWTEHYYTRDYTLGWTQQDLSCAHNVDVTDIDQGLKDHNFPWRWYYETISGKFPEGYFLDNRKLVWMADGVEYGFARSRELSGPNRWSRSLKLPTGNKAVKFKK